MHSQPRTSAKPSVASLQRLIADQQAIIADLQRQVEALQAEQHLQAQRLQQIAASETAPSLIIDDGVEAPTSALSSAESEEGDTSHAIKRSSNPSRRALLKWGGVGAAATLAAGAATLSQTTAHASDGGSLLLGSSNTAEHTTSLAMCFLTPAAISSSPGW